LPVCRAGPAVQAVVHVLDGRTFCCADVVVCAVVAVHLGCCQHSKDFFGCCLFDVMLL